MRFIGGFVPRPQLAGGAMSVGADKAYNTRDFVETLRAMGVRPHVTQNVTRTGGSAIDGRDHAAPEL
jgi:hypothetical protein